MPRRKRVPWWIWALALAVHVPVAFLLISRRFDVTPLLFDAHDIVMNDSARAIPLPYSQSRRLAPLAARQPQRPSAAVAPTVTPTVIPPASIAAVPPTVVDSPPTGATAGLRPRYGDGRLWLQPLPASPREIARTLTGKTNAQLTDSVVTAMVQTYLDAMAREQMLSPSALPSWTTKIGGKTVGLDSKWIYLGPLKIPTMLLALLPINVQANPTQAEFNSKLRVMRADLMEAARRAATFEDFKRAVKDLHDETERKREFRKNQRTPPDTSHRG